MSFAAQPQLHNALLHAAVPLRLQLFDLMQSRTGWLRERIRAYQEKHLRELIDYCWRYVPYYRSRWRQFISDPREIRALPDLQRLPVVTKEELREEQAALTTPLQRLRGEPARTGGSTGRPMLFRMNRFDAEMAHGGKLLIVRSDWLRRQGLTRPPQVPGAVD